MERITLTPATETAVAIEDAKNELEALKARQKAYYTERARIKESYTTQENEVRNQIHALNTKLNELAKGYDEAVQKTRKDYNVENINAEAAGYERTMELLMLKPKIELFKAVCRLDEEYRKCGIYVATFIVNELHDKLGINLSKNFHEKFFKGDDHIYSTNDAHSRLYAREGCVMSWNHENSVEEIQRTLDTLMNKLAMYASTLFVRNLWASNPEHYKFGQDLLNKYGIVLMIHPGRFMKISMMDVNPSEIEFFSDPTVGKLYVDDDLIATFPLGLEVKAIEMEKDIADSIDNLLKPPATTPEEKERKRYDELFTKYSAYTPKTPEECLEYGEYWTLRAKYDPFFV